MNNSSSASTQRGVLPRAALTLLGLLLGSLVASCNSSDSGGQATIYMVGGTVTGLAGTVVLQNNGGDDLSVTTNGNFAFKTPLPSGSAYSVTVKTQPSSPAQSCTVTNGNGTVGSANVSNVGITCTTRTFTVGGSVSGLTAGGLILENNGGDDLSVAANSSSFQFTTAVASGAAYAVSVKTQPTGQTCNVTSASGTVGSAPITTVAVACTTNSQVACGQENGTVINHTNNITADETWVGQGTVHLVANSINVLAPATLTVAPCAVVKLKTGVEIVIKGDDTGAGVASLISAGTDATNNFVTFTSADTQGWARLRGFNSNSHLELDFTVIKNGGNAGGQQRNAVISMTGSSVAPDPVLKINTAKVQGVGATASSGIYLSNATFTADSHDLVLAGGYPYPIAMTAMATGSIPQNTSFDATFEEILVVENANIFDNLTISTTLPIHFQSSVHVGGLAPNFVPNVTLTLGAGVTLKFESQPATPSMVTFGDLGQSPNKNAALVVHGTALEPVIFTSGAAAPAPGDWAGLWLATSAGSQLDHVVIEYAGADAAVGPQSCGPIVGSQRARNTGALFVGDNDPNQYIPPSNLITNSVFRNNDGNYAIDAVWTSATFGPDLTAGNSFGAGPQLCKQGKNLVIGGCVVNHLDESGCLVQ